MFQALPQETIFEARAKARRDTVLLFLLLFLLYGACFAAMGLALVAFHAPFLLHPRSGFFWGVAGAGLSIGALIAFSQFFIAHLKTLDELSGVLWAKAADPADDVHERVLRLVREAETATGLRGIRVLVIPSPAMNAFSLADRTGAMAIGVTEGLAGRLDRAELGAVIAHEAAHLTQGDSRLLTVAGSLCSSFETVTDAASPFQGGVWGARGTWGRNRRGGSLPVYVVALVGRTVARMLAMALSRRREFLADAQAVRMTRNPLALASALRKIAGKYRGGDDAPPGLQMVFILNPEAEGLDEREGAWADLFSTHPPVAQRIARLLDWAKADVSSLPEGTPEDVSTSSSSPAPEARYMAFLGDTWQGPYTFTQLLACGQVKPDTWVCPEGGAAVAPAGDTAALALLFTPQVQGSLGREQCPHCHVALVRRSYEGAPIAACPFCSGTLLTGEVLERIVARRNETFTEAQMKEALAWRKAQRECSIQEADCGVAVRCPRCARVMSKAFHLLLTRVVIDRCPYDGTVWLDGGELERIQILVENSKNL